MNLLFWKHKKEGHVIKHSCKAKLPSTVHSHYHSTDEQPTHYYDDDTSLITGIVIGEILSSDNLPSQDNSQESFSGFGGGDFGGGGSSGSFDTPDSGSSYDSGSSF